jgi:haloacetate dehalogenase
MKRKPYSPRKHTTKSVLRLPDLEHAKAAGNGIVAPILALWGAKGTIGSSWDVLGIWRAKASSTVSGRSLDCGHFLEERPEETLEELQHFFGTV